MSEEIDSNVLRKFEISHRVGRGAYGIVWEATSKKTGHIVALKKIFDAFQNNTDAQRTFREIMLLQSLKHPNIIKLINVYRAINDRDIYLTFEYMETDLHSTIRANILQEIHQKYIFFQILCCMKYLHSAQLVHRDMKPSNVLINSDCLVKVCDFGLARSLTSKGAANSQVLTDYVATRWYRAPEILFGSAQYTTGVDLWACGCILGEMISCKAMFPGHSTMDQIDRIIRFTGYPSSQDIEAVKSPFARTMLESVSHHKAIKFETAYPKEDRDKLHMLDKLLRFNPKHRLSADDCLKLKWMKDFHCEEDEPVAKGPITIPLDDNHKLTMREYRSALYRFIQKKRKSAKSKIKRRRTRAKNM